MSSELIDPFQSILVHWFLKCRCSLLSSPIWTLPICLIHGCNITVSYEILFFTASDFTSITCHIHNWELFLLWLHLFILSGVISPQMSSHILGTYRPGEFLFQYPINFAFSFCSRDSQGKNTEVVCHSLFQWSPFCENSPPWPVHLEWPYMTWIKVSLN